MAPPPPAARRCSHGTPRPPRPPLVASGSPLDPLPPKRCPPGATELALCGDSAPRSDLARRCWRHRRRDRRTPRRRFPARSACPRGVAGGPRPEQCPETLGAGDSAGARRRRAAPVRPQSALLSSLLPSPPPLPRPKTPPWHPWRGTPRGVTSPADAPRDGTAPGESQPVRTARGGMLCEGTATGPTSRGRTAWGPSSRDGTARGAAPLDGTARARGGGARQCDRQTLSEGRPARGRRWCRRGPRGQQARTSR